MSNRIELFEIDWGISICLKSFFVKKTNKLFLMQIPHMTSQFMYLLGQVINFTMRVRYGWGWMYTVIHVGKCLFYYDINNFKTCLNYQWDKSFVSFALINLNPAAHFLSFEQDLFCLLRLIKGQSFWRLWIFLNPSWFGLSPFVPSASVQITTQSIGNNNNLYNISCFKSLCSEILNWMGQIQAYTQCSWIEVSSFHRNYNTFFEDIVLSFY